MARNANGFSFLCAILIFVCVGISYLVKLEYQSIHHGTLIDAWPVYSSKNNFVVVEKFRYLQGNQNQTCLIKRTTARNQKQTKKIAKKKKRGTQRKLWLRTDGHCTDSALRSTLLRNGIGFCSPLALAICWLIGFLFFNSTSADESAGAPTRVSRSEPKDGQEPSTMIEIEMPEGAV
jgi:hypothetical protein